MKPLNTPPASRNVNALTNQVAKKLHFFLPFLVGLLYSINSLAQNATIPSSVVTCSESGITTIAFTAT
jgi:hypothetical protein